jgi:hypothetical protein
MMPAAMPKRYSNDMGRQKQESGRLREKREPVRDSRSWGAGTAMAIAIWDGSFVDFFGDGWAFLTEHLKWPDADGAVV